jgi:hypothetical protein
MVTTSPIVVIVSVAVTVNAEPISTASLAAVEEGSAALAGPARVRMTTVIPATALFIPWISTGTRRRRGTDPIRTAGTSYPWFRPDVDLAKPVS